MYKKFSNSVYLRSKLQTFFPQITNDDKELERSFMYVIKTYPKEFGQKLKELRIKNDYQQVGLANLLNVSQAAYSSWETGGHLPRLHKIKELLDLYQIDPSELIISNPEKKIDGVFVPLVDSKFFIGNRFYDFEHKLLCSNELEAVSVPIGELCDFSFKLEDDEMFGSSKGIMKGSVLLCSFYDLKNALSNEDKYALIHNRLVVLSICGGPAMLREVRFEGNFLRIIAWNEKVSDIKIAITSNIEPSGNFDDSMLINGHVTSDNSVQFYGVVTKAFFDFN